MNLRFSISKCLAAVLALGMIVARLEAAESAVGVSVGITSRQLISPPVAVFAASNGLATAAQQLALSNSLVTLSRSQDATTSNALLSLAYGIGANATNYVQSYSLSTSNALLALALASDTVTSNALVSLAYGIGAHSTNYTLTTSNLLLTVARASDATTSNALHAIWLSGSNALAAMSGGGSSASALTNAVNRFTGESNIFDNVAYFLSQIIGGTLSVTNIDVSLLPSNSPALFLLGSTDGTNIRRVAVPSGGTATNSPITHGAGVSSNNVSGVPLYSVNTIPTFTNAIAPPGRRLAGVNMVLRPGQDWWEYYATNAFYGYVTNDVALAKAAGFDTIRLIMEIRAIYTNSAQFPLATALERYGFFIKHCATNGIKVYANTGDCFRDDTVPSGGQLTAYTNILANFGALFAANANVVGCDMVQEVAAWQDESDSTLTNILGAYRTALKSTAPRLPVTASMNFQRASDFTSFFKFSVMEPYVDFWDIHIYYPMAHFDMGPLLTNFTKPFIIGESGSSQTNSAELSLDRYQRVAEIASHPMCEGAMWWALTDQSSSDADKWGLYEGTGPTLRTNDHVQLVARSLPRLRSTPMVVTIRERNEGLSLNVAGNSSTNPPSGTVHFKFPFPVRIAVNGHGDLEFNSGSSLIALTATASTLPIGYHLDRLAVVNGASAFRTTVHYGSDSELRANEGGSVIWNVFVPVSTAVRVYNGQTRFKLEVTPATALLP